MLERIRGSLNHLTQGRRPPRYPGPMVTTPPRPSGFVRIQDCYLAYDHADVVIVATAGPCIVSRVLTGYIGRCPAAANHVLMAAGEYAAPPE